MMDFLLTAFADYGMAVLSWALAALAVLGGKYLWGKIGNDWARGVVARAYDEVKAAVLEVAQVYVDALKVANKDGKLTDAEKTHAKDLAMKTAKSNIGAKGLKRLGRVLGVGIEQWLENKTEAAVRSLKASGDPT